MNKADNKVDVDALVEAAKEVLRVVRLRAMLNAKGFQRFKESDMQDKREEYDYSIVINDDKSAVKAINNLRTALGEEYD